MSSELQSKRVIIIFHRADYDGLFSGNIARKFYIENGYKVDMKGWNYGDDVPNFQDIINKYSEICILDISFDPSIMKTLNETGKAYWIDHHIGTIRDSEENGYSNFPGSRTKEKISAAEVAWNYFYKGIETPHIIELISAYDVWDHDRFSWDDEVTPIQYALRANYGLNAEKLWRDWDSLVNTDYDECEDSEMFFDNLLNSGSTILQYLKSVWKSWCSNYAFEVVVAGKYKGICMLSAQPGSLQFESVLGEKKYDVQVVVNRKGPDKYNVSIYKESDDCNDFDCSWYASKVYGTGNGHKSAAGFLINLEQFETLIKEQKI